MQSIIHENNGPYEAMHAFRIVLVCAGAREVMIVRSGGNETDTDALVKALDAAENGYPDAPIQWIECTGPGRYIPTGLQADEVGDCFWAS